MDVIWKIVVRPDPALPHVAQGWAMARDRESALRLAGQPMALAYPCRKAWPGKPGECLAWESARAVAGPPDMPCARGHRQV